MISQLAYKIYSSDMNSAFKETLINSNSNFRSLRAALFHSTPVLERKRRNSWDSRCRNYTRRFRRTQAKQTLLRNVNSYAELLFQSWKEDGGDGDPSSSQGPSWFKKKYSSKGPGRYKNGNHGPRNWYKRDPQFCEDDVDIENIFRSAFGGNRFFYWSFVNEENPQWKRMGGFSNYERSWKWKHRREDEYDSSSESESGDSHSDLVSHRLALGLSASGPLKLDDVKHAYRVCALKWHPDRHQGSSKVIAEEKFKHCSAAYQSLCDKLALD